MRVNYIIVKNKMSELEEHLKLDREKIKVSVGLQLPIEMTSYTLPRNTEVYIRNVMEMFLEECHQDHLKEYLNFCLSELLTNAKKANTKRVYFQEKGLDINNPDDYEKGMENFKMDTLTNIDHYLELQRKAGLYIKLSLRILADKIYIEIKNNSKLTVFEKERIQQKLDSVQQYKDMNEVFTNVLDQSEGAGLGIIIIILMLQKVGLSKDNYQVLSEDDETITRIILPCNKVVYSAVEMIAYEFVNLEDTVPVLKDTFEKANAIVNTGDTVDRKALYEVIRKDLSLALLPFKYVLEQDKNCFDLQKAIAMLSDYDLKFIYSESNPRNRIIEDTGFFAHILRHSRRVAYFTYNLYKNCPAKDNFPQDENYMYLLGLFNSMGAVLIAGASKAQTDYITELSQQYPEYGEKILDIFLNRNASTYLSMVAAKRFGFARGVYYDLVGWNGLEQVPKGGDRDRVAILHLAEMLDFYRRKMTDFYQVDKYALKLFNIVDENQFSKLAEDFYAGYEAEADK